MGNADMEPELAIVVAEVTWEITKTTLARTQQMSAKKAKKKAAKKPKKAKKAKKAKKPKKKKKKKAKKPAKQKAAGKGIFKVRTCSAALTAITGKAKMSNAAIVKAVWGYMKPKKKKKKKAKKPK